MKRLSSSTWIAVKLLSIFLLSTVGYLYLDFFQENLETEQWEHVSGFTRIVVPDTFVYKAIVDENNVITSILISGVKNTIGPSLLWVIADFNWMFMLFVNIVFVYFIVVYMERLAEQYQISQRRAQLAISLFLFMPMTLYYTFGALKELPMMLFLLMLVYYFNLKNLKIAIVVAVLLILFRYQLAILFLLILLMVRFRPRTIRWSVIMLVVVSAIYPAISSLGILSVGVTESFREEYGQVGSIGAQVEILRNDVYFLSIFGVVIRTFQSLFEPIITFVGNFSFYEDDSLSVYRVVQFVSIVMIIPYVYLFLVNLKFVAFSRARIANDVQGVYAFLLIAIILVGGFSFIHHRYLVPFFPLLMLVSLISRKRMKEVG